MKKYTNTTKVMQVVSIEGVANFLMSGQSIVSDGVVDGVVPKGVTVVNEPVETKPEPVETKPQSKKSSKKSTK